MCIKCIRVNGRTAVTLAGAGGEAGRRRMRAPALASDVDSVLVGNIVDEYRHIDT